MDYKFVTECRICGSSNLRKYLDLGNQPLANNLVEGLSAKKYPLQVLFCEKCSLSQLSIVVSPKILYKDYPYRSSISQTFKEHCKDMALIIKGLFKDAPGNPLVVDIASNDGCLLEQFRTQGYYTMGVEPCKELAKEAAKKDINTINEFFSEKLVSRIPACDVITATNVLAHIDDIKGFIKACKKLLRAFSKGILVIEVPYIYNLISNNQFDTIYHEHLSYFSFKPLKELFSSLGIPIFRVEQYPIHGGSLRIYASQYDRDEESSVRNLLDFEKKNKVHDFRTYKSYAKKVEYLREHFVNLLEDLKSKNKKVMGYGASAKGISLLNYCGLDDSHMSAIVDDTIQKQGKRTPGSGIPIVNRDNFDTNKPDYIALLSWNFSNELKANTRSHKARGGKYIIPIPQVRIE